MDVIGFLIIFPLLAAVALALIKDDMWRGVVVRLSAAVIGAASIYLAFRHLGGPACSFAFESQLADKALALGDVAITAYLLYRCRGLWRKQAYIPILLILQLAIMLTAEFTGKAEPVAEPLYADGLSVIMALIIGIIGSLICVYALGYMREYHEHHREILDRRRTFFFTLFFFLSGMFGVVFTSNLVWMFFFWEVTTLCSFLLIGYARDEEAVRNAFLALWMNTLGGIGFAVAIFYQASSGSTLDINRLVEAGPAIALVPAVLISFAGMAKSAQLPFSSWLLGAMVAPTPVSALLHSSTMVKAGVFAIMKFAPVFQGTRVGLGVALVGGLTFLIGSLAAVTQSNAKRVLAYSTVANLGLVVACAGVGTAEAVWAGVLLIIFHAVAKGLLFLGVGTIEHKIGSRDIEDMEGLIIVRSKLALVMVIGICGMFLAPFGMLISKWTCLKAFVDASPLLAIVLAYGSAPTIFFWAKWMGKVVSVPSGSAKGAGSAASRDEGTALGILVVGVVLTTALFPLISRAAIDPYLWPLFGEGVLLEDTNVSIMLVMLGLLVLIPVAFFFYPKKSVLTTRYLAGANTGPGATFVNSLRQPQEVSLRNYYLSGFFSEPGLMRWGVVIAVVLILGSLAMVTL